MKKGQDNFFCGGTMGKEQRHFNRRDFLSTGLPGIAAGGILGALNGSALSHPVQVGKPDAKKEIITRALGNTGIKIPIVSMGVMNASQPELVRHSYEKGIRLFDTAAYYQRGKNEEMIGSVLQRLNARKEVIIATKIYLPEEQRTMPSDQVKAFYLKTAEESLKRLQTGYFDILLSHNVSDIKWLNNPGAIEALRLLKKQGKARFIGFSTHANMAECMQDAVRSGLHDVIVTTFNFALSDDQSLLAALKQAHENKIGLIAMKTQYPRKEARWKDLMQSLSRRFHELYYDDRTVHAAILKWTLRHQFIATAIPGCTTFQHIDDDFAVAYDLEYTDQEKKFLTDMNLSLSFGYCRQCCDCVQRCSKGVDIPTLMRVHLYATCYNNFTHARQTFDDIPLNKSLGNCIFCSQCSAQCRHGVNIAHRIDELKTIYG